VLLRSILFDKHLPLDSGVRAKQEPENRAKVRFHDITQDKSHIYLRIESTAVCRMFTWRQSIKFCTERYQKLNGDKKWRYSRRRNVLFYIVKHLL